MLKEKDYKMKILYPAKKLSKSKGEIKAVPDKQKLK